MNGIAENFERWRVNGNNWGTVVPTILAQRGYVSVVDVGAMAWPGVPDVVDINAISAP